MAPGQVPHHSPPWREAHSFYLLSPLMGFLSRAWSRLRGPEPPEPWLVEAVIGENLVEGGLEGEVKASLEDAHRTWVRHPQEKAEDSGVPEEGGEAALGPCLDLKASNSPSEVWGLSGDGEYSEDDANSVPREQGREFTDGQPLSPSLLIRVLQGSDKSPGEEEAEEEGVVEGVTKFSYPSSHWEQYPVPEDGDEEPIKKEAPAASSSPESSGSKLSTCVYCPGEEENRTTEEKGTENEARETSISPSLSGSSSRNWGCCAGERPGQKGGKACEAPGKEAADPEPWSSVPAQKYLLGAWEYQPSKNTEEEDDEDSALVATEKGGAEGPPSVVSTSASRRAWVCRPGEDTEDEENSDSGSAEEEGEAEASFSTPPSSAFLKAWVYHPGEDAEEDEDSDWESTEEEGDAEASSPTPPTSVLFKAWVYRPGEDTEEDEGSDWESTEEEGEAEASSPTPPTSALFKAWVYRPGEDTEEEDECEQNDDKGEDSGAAAWGQCLSLQAQSAHIRGRMYQPGKETEEEDAEEEWEAETGPFRVAIYLPGEKPPPPWTAPKLPLRLQRRLRSSQTPTQDLDPETPPKTRKVRFSEKVTVHFLTVWAGPAQAARKGPWEQLARDRSRFARRIARAQEQLGPCLTPASRARAWARLGNAPSSLAPIPASTQTSSPPLISSEASVQATPLSHAMATPPHTPSCEAPALCLNLNGRRG